MVWGVQLQGECVVDRYGTFPRATFFGYYGLWGVLTSVTPVLLRGASAP